MIREKDNQKKICIILSIIILLLTIIMSMKIGSLNASFLDIIKGVFLNFYNENVEIIKDLRLPRVLVAVLVGANLAIAGVLLQAVIRNPLADPCITGISSGACLFSVFIIVFIPKLNLIRPIIGVIGGIISCTIVYLMAYKKGLVPIRIVLSGAAINTLLGGLTSMIVISGGPGDSNIQGWISGSLTTSSWNQVHILLVYSIIGITMSIFLSKSCNIIVLGSKNARSLGFNSNLQMSIITIVAVFLAGISTAVTGIISFVGLVVPHICRMIIGSDHKYLIPFSGIVGSILLLIADTIGRTIIKPYEISVGIVMAVIGAPFFLYLLRRSEV